MRSGHLLRETCRPARRASDEVVSCDQSYAYIMALPKKRGVEALSVAGTSRPMGRG
jgi:hypothetical protein